MLTRSFTQLEQSGRGSAIGESSPWVGRGESLLANRGAPIPHPRLTPDFFRTPEILQAKNSHDRS